MFNLLGEPVDNKPAPTPEAYWPIHRPAPSYEEQQSTTEILETGIKVVDLICPCLLYTSSIPFAGRYRMVDFVLSSMANCGISNVSVVVRKNCLLYTSRCV